MTGVVVRTAVAALGCALSLVGCAVDAPRPEAVALAYCTPTGSGDEAFWAVVHATCAVAQDGDVLQAHALRQELDEKGADEVAAFRRTFRRLNRALRVADPVADDLCMPGLGLGEDLGQDYRSWIIAHGQAAYDAVLADPAALRQFPDAQAGCGLGEPFGAASYS